MKPPYTKSLSIMLLLVSLAFLAIGLLRTLKVHDLDTELFYHRIPERVIVIDATFSGIVRKDGKLYSTYDRSLNLGRQACPT